MGCICSKGTSSNQYVAENHVRDKDLRANRSSRHSGPSRGERIAVEADDNGNDATARLISDPSRDGHAGSTPNSPDEREKNVEITGVSSKPQVEMNSNMGIGVGGQGQPRLSRIYGGERGAQVLAGWPSWLTAVAGEAISGWIPRRADSFEKLEKVS
ncbi:hypothetical protein L6164_032437 [Bauhinia variegata]|uniref:Uncharacterized protein n=1 Tax=Bauhinia variegata TaxID=167791 RepID=A0ACB9KNP4_BAUVA|nr:hypothetical protein L6164_032437 [Bauhinia variegata]